MFQWKINLLRKIFPEDFLLVLSEISNTAGFPLKKVTLELYCYIQQFWRDFSFQIGQNTYRRM